MEQKINTFCDILLQQASANPTKPAYIYVQQNDADNTTRTYEDLLYRSLGIAAELRDRNLGAKRALLLYPPGLEFIEAFYACLFAGVTAVPMYIPSGKPPVDARLTSIAARADVAIVLSSSSRAAAMESITALAFPPGQAPPVLLTDLVPACGEVQRPDPTVPALIQFTSGSTDAPKGVVVSHGNILHNQACIREGFGHRGGETVVGWLPFFHDMGLIGNILQPAFLGGTSVLTSPASFLQKPVRWLEMISRFRPRTSGGPNFAYEACLHRVGDEHLAGLDLSSWEIAFNGSERIRADTLRRFGERFAPCGFDVRAFLPCYGLAESTLYVTGRRFDPDAPQGEEVDLGRPNSGLEVRILEPDSLAEVPPGEVGEICVAGESVAQGYFRDPDRTAQVFPATADGVVMRTGDLGRVVDGELRFAGRLKNVLILNGKNFYGEEIEQFASTHSDRFVPDGGCILQLDEGSRRQRVVFVQEVRRVHTPTLRNDDALQQGLATETGRAVLGRYGVAIDDFVYLAANRLPRTSSGKLDRGAIRRGLEARELPALGEVALRTA